MPVRLFSLSQLLIRPAAFGTHYGQLLSDDDDASISSTLTVERIISCANKPIDAVVPAAAAPKSCSPSSSSGSYSERTSAATKKRVVRFDLNANAEYENESGVCREECARFWYDVTDFARFKENLSRFARHVARSEQQQQGSSSAASRQTSYSAVLRRTYLACCCEAAEEDAGNDQAFLSGIEREQLQQWVNIALCRHGAERNCVQYLRRERRERRRGIVALVLRLQAEVGHCHLREEEIRARCERFSLPSRRFARTMAAASAAAAGATADR